MYGSRVPEAFPSGQLNPVRDVLYRVSGSVNIVSRCSDAKTWWESHSPCMLSQVALPTSIAFAQLGRTHPGGDGENTPISNERAARKVIWDVR